MKMMIRKYRIPILFLAVVMLLLALRMFNSSQFISGAQKNALPAIQGINLLNINNPLPDNTLIVAVQTADKQLPFQHPTSISITTKNLFEQATLRSLKKHEGAIVIWSDKLETAVSSWMALAQMGIKDHYLLMNNRNDEHFIHQFLPDTSLAGKESEILSLE
jgi:hypothetical protein